MLPTRNDSIHDLVLSNCNNVVCDVIVGQPLINCDNVIHFKIIKQSVMYKSSVNKSIVLTFYNLVKANFAGIALDLKNIDWALFFIGCLSINNYWTKWWSYIMSLVDKYVPVECAFRNIKPRFRLPIHICNLLYKHNHAWRMYRIGVRSARAQYIRLRSRCKAALHIHFKNIEERILNSKSS